MMKTTDIELGDQVKDAITGFEGVVICVSYWLNGCMRVVVQSKKTEKGLPTDPVTFDVEQLRITKKKVFTAASPSGGPCADHVAQRR